MDCVLHQHLLHQDTEQSLDFTVYKYKAITKAERRNFFGSPREK